LAKGFTDSKGNFRPTGNSNGTSSKEKTIEPTGTRLPTHSEMTKQEEDVKAFATVNIVSPKNELSEVFEFFEQVPVDDESIAVKKFMSRLLTQTGGLRI
jgi:hypothetical protein